MVQSGARSDRRIEDLESGIERLRNQQEAMKRKLKKQAERKTKLEVHVCLRGLTTTLPPPEWQAGFHLEGGGPGISPPA